MKMKTVYTAMPKKIFYHRFSISKFVLEQGYVPINPFMVFDYYFGEGVDRNKVREANNNLVAICEELWVFGDIPNGVEREIEIAEKNKRKIRYFSIDDNVNIQEIKKKKQNMGRENE